MGWQGKRVMKAAAAAGDLSVVVYAGEMHAPQDETAVYAACRHGHLTWSTGSWAAAVHGRKNEHDPGQSVRGRGGGHLVLQFLRSQHMNAKWNRNTPMRAAEHGHLEVLRWAMEHHCPVDPYTYHAAAMFGHVHILEYLNTTPAPYDAFAANAAAGQGHVHVLEWFKEHGYILWQDRYCSTRRGEPDQGPRVGVLPTLDEVSTRDWAHADIMAEAAGGGHVEPMQWLRDRGTDWDTYVPNAAAHEGNSRRSWLADKGCPLDLEDAITACFLGEKDSWNNTFEASVWLIETYARDRLALL